MIINVLISTINDGILKVEKTLQPIRPDVKYIISHQYTENKFLKKPIELIRDDVIISQIPGKGLSRSRNHALNLADGDIAIIADDDITFIPDAFDTIKEVYLKNPSADVICFKIKTKPDEPEYKSYPYEPYCLNNEVKHYISSVEISFRVKSIKTNNIIFDRRFGLGSNYIFSGEEEIFIYDCMMSNLKVKYFPYYIVNHEYKHISEKNSLFLSKTNFKYAAIDAYKMGWSSLPYSLKKTKRLIKNLIRSNKNPLFYFSDRLRGSLYILLTKR